MDSDERVYQVLRALNSSDYVRQITLSQIRQFDEMFTGKVYPPFADPERQAEDFQQKRWEERMSEPGDGDVDPGDIADDVRDEGIAFYETLWAMHTSVLNLFSAGLFHLLEQQSAALGRHWTGETIRRQPLERLCKWLRDNTGIDLATSPSWPRLTELGLVANVVKHAEGRSAEDLRRMNPNYFRLPLMREPGYQDIPTSTRPVDAPLAGEDIWITKGDYDTFLKAVGDFWEWVATELDKERASLGR